MSRLASFLLLAWGMTLAAEPVVGQRVTSEERQTVKAVKSQIDAAGKSFKAKKLEEAVTNLASARAQLEQLTANARPELARVLEPEYARLAKAHRLLTEAGQTLAPLPSFEEAISKTAETVSFQKEVAPILVAKCGNCHVNQTRGRFSAASFDALERSTTIAFGIPQDSRLIQVIESGEMPKGGLTVSPEELETLKSWIRQGAKFDGEDRNLNLNQLAGGTATAMTPALAVAKPTGTETVSFGLHIAPILVENCAQCHMVNNPRGNFSQASFESFLRGGDSGAPIKPGDAEASILFRRLAAGEMPPSGKLPAASLDLVKTWIEEGAKFDGLEPRTTLVAVAKTAKAGSQSHDELLADRQRLSLSHWALVMDKATPIQIPSDNFQVFSSSDEPRTQAISEMLESLVPKLATYFKVKTSTRLIKGNTSIFLFDKRYDFSEFGKMISRQELPKEQSGYWDFTITDSFASLLLTRNQTADDAEPLLVQQLAAIYTASLAPDIPRWFSDGTGYWIAAKHLSKNEQVKAWEAESLTAVQAVKSPAELLEGRMSAQDAGLVGFQVVKVLKKKSGAFDRMLDNMRQGESFETAFESAYGTPLATYLTRGW